MKKLLLLLLFVFATVLAFSQVSQEGTPFNWQSKSITLSDVPVISTKKLDIDKILAEDEARSQKNMDTGSRIGDRFGVERAVDINFFKAGISKDLGNGDLLWRLGIDCPEATSISFLFSEWELPEGAELTIWNEDRTKYLGIFTHENNKEYGSLAIAPILSDKVYIEYYEPKGVGQAKLRIKTIIHGYLDIFSKPESQKGPFGTSASCNININCGLGNSFQDEKRGVALILDGGFAHCTGSLVNTTRNNGAPFFLTAAHCIINTNPNNYMFIFNHESNGCNGNTGPTNNSVSGARLLRRSPGNGFNRLTKSGDYALLRLSRNVPLSFNPYYNGWNRKESPNDGRIFGIHHPGGDIKKISRDNGPTRITAYAENFQQNGNGTHWRVSWDRGITAAGSSGSPLMRTNGRIIGVLSGGSSFCFAPTQPDWYGAFNQSWPALRRFLSPNNNSIKSIGGFDPNRNNRIAHLGEDGPGMLIYPNPTIADEDLRVEYELSKDTEVTLGIYNLLGALLQESTHQGLSGKNTFWLNPATLPPGTYVLNATTEDTRATQLFIVSKP